MADKAVHQRFTDESLLDWLERYVKAIFPDHCIDYWSNGRNIDASDRPLPSIHAADGYKHTASYVAPGGEASIIHVGLMLKNGSIQTIGRAKSFGSNEQNWLIARSISEALESMYLYNEMPEIIGIVEKLPIKSIDKDYQQELWIGYDQECLAVVESGTERELVRYDFSCQGNQNASQYSMEPYLKDWRLTLNRFHIRFTEMPLLELYERISAENTHKALMQDVQKKVINVEQPILTF